MLGRMQHQALTVDRFLTHAARWHGATPVCERHRGKSRVTTYSEIYDRARQLSAALIATGIAAGDRVATIAMNHIRHLEAWYGIMGIGAVCHTVNPRLFKDQLRYILEHAGSRIILADDSFASLAYELAADCPNVERVMIFADGPVASGVSRADDYDAWIGAHPVPLEPWSNVEEEAAAGLCYTSGTTGHPKGVLYSHRSHYLHTLMTLQHDALNLSAADVVLPVVPMFHANAWGIAFSGPAVGARLVLPGAQLDGPSLHAAILEEEVTFAAGVPTVWQGLLQHVADTGEGLGCLKSVLVGGSACPPGMIRVFEDRHGIEVIHAWGMTETSPVASLAVPTHAVQAMSAHARHSQACKQGRPMFGIDVALETDEGSLLDHDGKTAGHLMVRGATVVRRYYGEESDAINAEGWFDTGDVATIDEHGYIQITDRAKDLIKSGGEWISSLDIENVVMGASDVACAAVVATPHERWGERPLLLVQPKAGHTVDPDNLRALLTQHIPSWWMPDEIRTVAMIPLGPTGKIDKKRIRAQLVDGSQ